MQAVLARDLEKALKSASALAPESAVGVSIGVVRNGARRVFTFGTAKPDAIFEIGSVTKTFTGLLLAQMMAQNKVTPDTPVRELLPPGTVAKPQGPEITLLDLVTQHSGLPPMPDNFRPADPSNPYADYRAANLYEFVGRQGVAKPAVTAFLYSNLGLGLLGHALANRANTTYAELIKQAVLEPLGMRDTAIGLSPDQQRRFVQGHSADQNTPAHAWDFDVLAGAGALRSTANDMLTYLEANLHPEKSRTTLSSALIQAHELRADVGPDTRIAFAWLYVQETGVYWHNGATGGYSSFCAFNPKENYATVVLLNKSIGQDGSFADLLGEHILQRFAGKPAVSLSD
jgi:D-alanyl-D-alanine-carboxypeptidase/D-alanyl-D-alanine-endopeptidase